MTEARRRARAFQGFVALLLSGGAALAAPSAEFRYLRDEGAMQCPNESAVREAVGARLGYDPFQRGATRTIRVSIETTSDGFRSRVELEGGPDGQAVREIATQGSCEELVSAIALSISLAIDAENQAQAKAASSAGNSGVATESNPKSADKPAPKPARPRPVAARRPTRAESPPREPELEPELEPEDDEPAEIPEKPPKLRLRTPHIPMPLDFALGADLDLAIGLAPGTAVGGALSVQGRKQMLSFSLELRGHLPAGTTLGDGTRIDSGMLAFGLIPCAHGAWFKGCLVALLGEVWAYSTTIPRGHTDLTSYAALGARAGIEWPQQSVWAFTAHAELMFPIKPLRIAADDVELWTASATFSTFALGALARF